MIWILRLNKKVCFCMAQLGINYTGSAPIMSREFCMLKRGQLCIIMPWTWRVVYLFHKINSESNETVLCPFRGQGSIPGCGGVFRGNFPPADHSLPTRPEPAWQKMAHSPSITPHNLWTSRRKAQVQPWSDNSWKKMLHSDDLRTQ